MVQFSERQRFTSTWLLLGMSLSVAMPLIFLGIEWYQHGWSWQLALAMGLLIGFFLLLVFGLTLSVSMTNSGIYYQYSPFIRKRFIAWQDLKMVELTSFDPIGEYWGWGIKKGDKGWCYTVQGDQGLRLTFQDGHSLLIGVKDRTSWKAALEAIAPSDVWRISEPNYNKVL